MQLIAVAVLSLGLGLTVGLIGGCSSSTKDQAENGKMNNDKMGGGKMNNDKMGGDKRGGDKGKM
jgi:hypothetical protein